MKSASSIIVTWHRKENGETVRHAYRLDVDSRDPFVRKLRDDLSVDYLRGQATVTPTIGLYLTNDDETLLAYYAIRYARGGGTSLSMKTLRQIAMSGIELTDDEISGIFTDDLRSKWPHPFGFDYTLPVTQNEN